MTNRDKLIAFLRQSPGAYYCDRCLNRLADLTNPSPPVNHILRTLIASGAVQRYGEYCSGCGRFKKCVAYLRS